MVDFPVRNLRSVRFLVAVTFESSTVSSLKLLSATAPLSDAAKSTRRLRGEKYRLRVATALTRREYCPLRNATCKIVLRGGFFPSFSLISFDAELNLNKRGRYTATRFACRDSMTMGKSLHSVDAEEK